MENIVLNLPAVISTVLLIVAILVVITNIIVQVVKKATWDILDECGQVGVMVGADCTVPMDIDDDRFNWVRKAAEEYAASH